VKDTERLIVLTGGPGSGKSTLAAALARRGFATMPEAGRAIIKDQRAIGGDGLPWADRAKFAGLMLCWDMRSYRHAAASKAPVVFDRGIPDSIGYLEECRLPIPRISRLRRGIVATGAMSSLRRHGRRFS